MFLALFFMSFIVIFINCLKYMFLSEADDYIYDRLFNKSTLISFLCTVIPIIPEIILMPVWIIKGIIFVSKKRSMLDLAINIAQFFKHESCGKCTPCREGNVHVLNILKKIKEGKGDLALLQKLSIIIRDTSLCGLGQSCTNHILTALKYFKGDFKPK